MAGYLVFAKTPDGLIGCISITTLPGGRHRGELLTIQPTQKECVLAISPYMASKPWVRRDVQPVKVNKP